MKSAPRRGSSAFTLIEMLVATAILAMLLIVLTSVIGKVSETWRWARVRADNYTKARISLDLLRRDLQASLLAVGLPGLQNAGGSPALEFYCTRQGPATNGMQSKRPLSLASYRVVDSGDFYARGLQRGLVGLEFSDRAPFAAAGSAFPAPAPAMGSDFYQVIGPGILRMDFRFLSRDGKTISRHFTWNKATPEANSAAVAICLLVIDEETMRFLESQSAYTALLQSFDAATAGVPASEIPYARWLEAIGSDATFAGLAAAPRIKQSLQIYERTIPLPVSP